MFSSANVKPYKPSRLACWIAIAAILMLALAPSISRLLNAERAGEFSLLDVCRASAGPSQGGDLVPASSDAPLSKHFLDHCPYCHLQGQEHLLAATPSTVALLELQFAMPRLFYMAATPLHAWYSSPPRGPPTLA